jgi:hypothetical protein
MSSTDDGTHPEIPDRQAPPTDKIPDAFDGPFFQQIGRRKAQERDAKIIITAKDAQTGVGKTSLSDFLGWALDTSVTGFSADKTTIDPPQYLRLYQELPPGSVAVLEEGGQLDSRRAMSNENVDTSHAWQMNRVREIVSIINLPSPDDIDSRLERLADYWINVERRGFARIYSKHIHPIKRSTYYKTVQTLEWPNMDKSATFKAMDKQKRTKIGDDERDDNWVRESEVQDRVDKAVKNARQDVRDALLTSVYRETQLTGSDVAGLSAVDIGAARVREIANE